MVGSVSVGFSKNQKILENVDKAWENVEKTRKIEGQENFRKFSKNFGKVTETTLLMIKLLENFLFIFRKIWEYFSWE